MFLRGLEMMLNNIPEPRRYPFSIPALKNLERLEFKNNVTFLVGENGSGKSTLLEAVAYQCGFNTAGGGRNNAYEVDASHSALGEHIRLSWLPKITNGFFLRAETFYHFASHLDTMPESLRYYGGQSLHKQSHGEAFLSLFTNRFGKKRSICWTSPKPRYPRKTAVIAAHHQGSGEGSPVYHRNPFADSARLSGFADSEL